MRPTIAATLLLSPMLLAASAVASQPSTDVPAAREYHRVTTGVAVPAVMDQSSFHLPSDTLPRATSSTAKIVLALNVDEKGNAQNVRVVQSANPELDAQVVSAVLQSRFRPATMNHQPIAIDMNLTLNVQQ